MIKTLNRIAITKNYKNGYEMVKDKALWTMFYMQIGLITFLVGVLLTNLHKYI